MKYFILVGLGILAGCVDYAGEGDDSAYWQLRELRREQQEAQIQGWANHAFEQNKLNQIQMDQARFNNYGFH